MWKWLAIVSITACVCLVVWNSRLRIELADEQQMVAALSEGKANADAGMKSAFARHEVLESSCRSLRGNVPGVGVCMTVVPSATKTVSPLQYVSRRIPDVPRMLVSEGMRWNLLSSLVLSDEERIAMSRILEAEQKKLRAAIEASLAKSLDMTVAAAVRIETDRQIYALLGKDRFLEFSDYRDFPVEQSRVGELNMRLVGSGQPALSVQARGALLLALREEVRPELAPSSLGSSSEAEHNAAYEIWRKEYEQRVRHRARTFLTREQLETFERQRSMGQ